MTLIACIRDLNTGNVALVSDVMVSRERDPPGTVDWSNLSRKVLTPRDDAVLAIAGPLLLCRLALREIERNLDYILRENQNARLLEVLHREFTEEQLSHCSFIWGLNKVYQGRPNIIVGSIGCEIRTVGHFEIISGGSGAFYFNFPDFYGNFDGQRYTGDDEHRPVSAAEFALERAYQLLLEGIVDDTLVLSNFGLWYEVIAFDEQGFRPLEFDLIHLALSKEGRIHLVGNLASFYDGNELFLAVENFGYLDIGQSSFEIELGKSIGLLPIRALGLAQRDDQHLNQSQEPLEERRFAQDATVFFIEVEGGGLLHSYIRGGWRRNLVIKGDPLPRVFSLVHEEFVKFVVENVRRLGLPLDESFYTADESE